MKSDIADLPLFHERYPLSPGYAKGSVTSRGAAETIAPKAGDLRMAILRRLLTDNLTPDELADALGVDRYDVRPRCSEMRMEAWGVLVEPTGEKRLSARGNPQNVLRLTVAGRIAANDSSAAGASAKENSGDFS